MQFMFGFILGVAVFAGWAFWPVVTAVYTNLKDAFDERFKR